MYMSSSLYQLFIREKLRGEPCRTIKSFLFAWHRDALEYQRRFRIKLYNESMRVDMQLFSRRHADIFVDIDGGSNDSDSSDYGSEGVGFSLAPNVTRIESLLQGRRAFLFINRCQYCNTVLSICTDDLRNDAHVVNRIAWYGYQPTGWELTVESDVFDSTCIQCSEGKALRSI